jgi:tetratricopeptide (TPR) repeat protein
LSLGLAAAARSGAGLDARYLELLRDYARGDRSQAVAALAHWSEEDLQKQVAIVQRAWVAAERCPRCKNPLVGVPLRAAVLLHADRDKADRPDPSGREQPPLCPGLQARLAGRYAALLARDPDLQDFARRFFLATSQQWQLEACFDDALRQARAGSALFPRDGELLLTVASVLEERAVLLTSRVGPEVSGVQREWLETARRDLTDAVSRDPDLALARMRLGRVLWRLGEGELARVSLEEGLRRTRVPGHRFLAHLFLGRVHEDAEHVEEALAQYRSAVEIDPGSQSAAVALSHALQLAGEGEEARLVLANGLHDRGVARDPFWDYLVVNAQTNLEMLATLHRESLE